MVKQQLLMQEANGRKLDQVRGWPSGRFISEKLSEGSRLLAIRIHAGKANDQPRPGLPFG